MGFKFTSDDEVRVIFNLFIQYTDCTFQFGIENKEEIKNLLPDLYNNDKYLDGDYLFDKFISVNFQKVNKFFVNYKTLDRIDSIIKGSSSYDINIKNLVSFATDKAIPIIKFPDANFQTRNHFEYVPRYYKENRKEVYRNCFIKFVNVEKDYLSSSNISKYNQLINFLAHEIGHALDEKIDLNKYNKKDKDYIIQRENKAWEIARRILNYLNIKNTKIELQEKLCVKSYKEIV